MLDIHYSLAAGFFLKGFLLGFAVSAPLGPVGVMCIRRTIIDGYLAGMAVGLGATTADVLYATVAALGLTAIADSVIPQQPLLRLVAAGFLFYLAFRAVRARGDAAWLARKAIATVPKTIRPAAWLGAYGTGFLLLITNPMAIVIFGSVFASLGLTTTGGDFVPSAAIVLGVFAGAQLWWISLASVTGTFRSRITPRIFRMINIGSGVALAAFGLVAAL